MKLPADPKLKGQVRISDKPSTSKLVSFFFAEGLEDIGPMLIDEVIKPAVRTLAYEIFVKTAAAAFFGKNNIPSNINAATYANAFKGSSTSSSTTQKKREVILGTISVATKSIGEYYVNRIKCIIKEYDVATVADLYDIAEKIHTDPVYNNYGWRNLPKSDGDYVVLTPTGWVLKLPDPEPVTRII